MHDTLSRTLGRILLALPLIAALAHAEGPDEALSRIAETYRDLPELAERIDYRVQFPDGRKESKAIEYARSGERAFVTMLTDDGSRLFHLVAHSGVLRATQLNIGGAYVEAPFEGSLSDAFEAAGARQVGLTLPPALAASSPTESAFLDAFGFGVVSALRPTGVEEEGGSRTIHLTAQGGEVTMTVDAESARMTGLSGTFGAGDSTLRLAASIVTLDIGDSDERWVVDTAGRRPVSDFAALEASAFPLGTPAPAVEITTLEGEILSLGSLRGRVVILDFWATWCVPCWSALEQMEELAKWAERSAMPISVWTVDTLERTTTFAEQASRVAAFLDNRGLEVPVLIDVDDSFFAALHSPGLPSTVVIAPDGSLAHYHSGVMDDLAERLRADATGLLESR